MNEAISKKPVRVGKPLKSRLLNNWQMYALLLIPVVLTIVYKYVPMYGIQIAFLTWSVDSGMLLDLWNLLFQI